MKIMLTQVAKGLAVASALTFASYAQAVMVDVTDAFDTNIAGFGTDVSVVDNNDGTNTLGLDVSEFGIIADAGSALPVGSMVDTLTFTIVAPEGYAITGISYTEGVTAEISGVGFGIGSGTFQFEDEFGTVGGGLGTQIFDASVIPGTVLSLGSPTITENSVGDPLFVQTIEVTIFNSLSAFASTGTVSLDKVMPEVTVTLTAVPLPPAVWLFGSALLGLVTVARRKKRA